MDTDDRLRRVDRRDRTDRAARRIGSGQSRSVGATRRDADRYILKGERSSISMADQTDAVVVFARTWSPSDAARGVTAFLVAMMAEGVSTARINDLGSNAADPDIARDPGFERRISHGLNTFGLACRAGLKRFAPGHPERLKSMSVRFAAPAYPGDTIRIELFATTEGVRFRARLGARPFGLGPRRDSACMSAIDLAQSRKRRGRGLASDSERAKRLTPCSGCESARRLPQLAARSRGNDGHAMQSATGPLSSIQ